MADHGFQHLREGNTRTALVAGADTHSYGEVDSRINRFAVGLLAGRDDLQEERIAFLLPASVDYVTCLHGVWRAGGIAVPLNAATAVAELDHYLRSARVARMFASLDAPDALRQLCVDLDIELLTVEQVLAETAGELPEIDPGRRAMMLFTSGTTSKPKGVVSTHKTIRAQITTLIDAWHWRDDDAIPLFLPLHHIHGIINILSCALWAGASVHLFAKLDIPKVTQQVAAGTYNVFMAVPTVYVKLIRYLEQLETENEAGAVQAVCAGFKAMRLNISGSAACPVKLFEQWRELTGQVLLERYGMTEIGMGISNPYHGERRAGCVGQPLPGVEVRLFDESHSPIDGEGTPGEIRIKGDNVFLEYWDNEAATRESFHDGWFRTGDMAVIERGYYRIMGRTSVDIIKSGGYKLSALEIEGVLLTHANITEVAVVGMPDEVWGEAVTAYIVTRDGGELDFKELKEWCNARMSLYKIPKHVNHVAALPRNAMGKVTKSALKSP